MPRNDRKLSNVVPNKPKKLKCSIKIVKQHGGSKTKTVSFDLRRKQKKVDLVIADPPILFDNEIAPPPSANEFGNAMGQADDSADPISHGDGRKGRETDKIDNWEAVLNDIFLCYMGRYIDEFTHGEIGELCWDCGRELICCVCHIWRLVVRGDDGFFPLKKDASEEDQLILELPGMHRESCSSDFYQRLLVYDPKGT